MERVAAFAHLLMRTIEAGRMPARHDPALRELEEELEGSLTSCLRRIGDFSLQVEDLDLLYAGQPVYRSSAREGSVPSTIFQDGVREIVLRRGLEPGELAALVDVLRSATDPRNRGWDDAVTLLWEQDFQHIDTVVLAPGEADPDAADDGAADPGSEPAVPGGEPGVPWPSETGREEDVEDGAGERCDDWSLPQASGRLPSGAPDAVRPFQPIEAENVRMTAAIEEAISPRDQVMAILAGILATESDPAAYLETASVLGLFIEQAMVEMDFARANRLADQLRRSPAGRKDRAAPFEAAAEEVLRHAGRAEFLKELVPGLNARPEIDLGELSRLLAQFGSSAAPALCDLLCEVQVKKVRRAICESLVISCKGDVSILIRQLSDSRWYVVRNVLYVLGRIAHQGVERALGEALYHEDIRVRTEAIRALAEVDSARGRAYLNSALRDPEKGIRILVARLISRRRSDRAAQVLWSVIESPEFVGRDAEERAAFFAALGRTGSDLLVPRLTRSLAGGGWLKTPDPINRKEAALALAWLGTPAALDVLKREAGSKRDEVRAAVGEALTQVRKAAPKEPGADWGR